MTLVSEVKLICVFVCGMVVHSICLSGGQVMTREKIIRGGRWRKRCQTLLRKKTTVCDIGGRRAWFGWCSFCCIGVTVPSAETLLAAREDFVSFLCGVVVHIGIEVNTWSDGAPGLVKQLKWCVVVLATIDSSQPLRCDEWVLAMLPVK